MKLKNIKIILLASCLAIAACSMQKEASYELPDAMLPYVKVEYAKRCEKGKVLYDLNCARCHTTKLRRKEIIPDFKPSQLLGYTLRVSNRQHEANMPDSMVTEEELGIIMTFLNYKKKNTPDRSK